MTKAAPDEATRQSILSLFEAFQRAVASTDLEAYRALISRDIETDDELFETNSARLKEASLALRLRDVSIERGVAVLRFAVVDATGREVDEGDLTAVEEDGTWRIASL